jgi:hypothetical protein
VTEIIRISGMIPNQGFGDFNRVQHGSPSPMASFDVMQNSRGTGSSGWNGLPHEVSICNSVHLSVVPSVCHSSLHSPVLTFLFYPTIIYDQICISLCNLLSHFSKHAMLGMQKENDIKGIILFILIQV